eukprot:171405_1
MSLQNTTIINGTELNLLVSGYIRKQSTGNIERKRKKIFSFLDIVSSFCLSSTVNYKYSQISINNKPHSTLGSKLYLTHPIFDINSLYYHLNTSTCMNCNQSASNPNILQYHCSYIQFKNAIQTYKTKTFIGDMILNNVDEYKCTNCSKYIAINLTKNIIENKTDSFISDIDKKVITTRYCSVFGDRQKTFKNKQKTVGNKCHECHAHMEILQRNSDNTSNTWYEYVTNIEICNHCDLVHETTITIVETVN